jgi:hypothetical protein
MINNKTGSKSTTNPRTGIYTVLVNAGFISWALCINNAFRFTFYIGIACVILNTFAGCSSSVF